VIVINCGTVDRHHQMFRQLLIAKMHPAYDYGSLAVKRTENSWWGTTPSLEILCLTPLLQLGLFRLA